MKTLGTIFGSLLTTSDTPVVKEEGSSLYGHWGTTPAHLSGTPVRK